jgi:hypothetical protein
MDQRRPDISTSATGAGGGVDDAMIVHRAALAITGIALAAYPRLT